MFVLPSPTMWRHQSGILLAILPVLTTVWVVKGVTVSKEFVASVFRVFRRNRTTECLYLCTAHIWYQIPQNLKHYWSSSCRCLGYGRSILLGLSL